MGKIFFLILTLVHVIAANPYDDFGKPIDKNEHPFGHPKNIITFDEQQLDNSTVVVSYRALDTILLHPDVKDRQVVVVSIVGAFRKGKSFFLNYCLRFLYANVSIKLCNCGAHVIIISDISIQFKSVASRTQPSGNISEWMGDGDEPLRGFSWKGGSTRDTTGLIFWSDVFLYDDDFKNKIAIVVMDTQGLFDKETPPADNTRIFALGTLISSIQFYNLNGVVQEDQLQYLQLATDFARLAATNNADKDTKAFQNIVFLMRDWDYLDEFPAGVQGGAGYLRDLLQIKDNQNPSLRSVREYVHQSFNKISCYLLPDPGKIVRRNPSSYKGEWSKIDEDFTNALNETIIDVLKPSELIPKKINGNVLKASELRDFMKMYFKAIESGETPKIESIYDITVRSQMNILIGDLLNKYKELLSKNVNFADPSFTTTIEINHQIYKNYTMLLYDNLRKMGSSEHKRVYKQQLDDEIERTYVDWKEMALKNYEALQEQIRETERQVQKKEELRKKLEKELKNTQDRIIEITNSQNQTNSKHNEEMKKLLESLQRQQSATLQAQNAQKAIEQTAQEAAAAVKQADQRIKQLEAHKVNTDKAVAEKEQIIQQYNNNQTEFVNKLKEIQKEVELSGKLLEVQRKKQSAKIRWHKYDSRRELTNMMEGGDTKFICRIKYDDGEVYNGEFPNEKHACYITFNNKRYKYEEFTVLGYFRSTWNKVKDQKVPSCAVEGGRLNSGVIMYICRAKTSDGYSIGSVINGKCKTPYPEIETYITYEILCV
ncbi:unnamed protein product [Diamesa serratosioi]